MKGFKITEIIKVVLEDILLELYFNVESGGKKTSFKISIGDDGEAIYFVENDKRTSLNDIRYESYSVVKISRDKDDLARLLKNKITNIHYGVGRRLDTNKDVIHYVKINTNKNEFLFFNNGDKGYYSFDKIEEILANDIYGYEWTQYLPVG